MPNWQSINDEITALTAYHERRRQADLAVANINAEQAYIATLVHDAYRFLPPGASFAFAAAGYGPDSDVVNRMARSWLESRSKADVAAYGETVTAQDLEPTGKGEGSIKWGSIGGALKRAVVDNWDDPMSKVRGATRAADIYTRFPVQVIQGQYRNTRKQVADKGLRQAFVDGYTSPRGFGENVARVAFQTDLGQSAFTLARGEQLDTGSGFFANDQKTLGRTRLQAEQQFSPMVTYSDGTRHVATIGRDIAGVAGLEPGSRGYAVVSGLGDASVSIASSKVSGAAGAERRLAKGFKVVDTASDETSAFARARATAGAIWNPGRRATFSPQLARSWLDGPDGKAVIEHLTGLKSTREIDQLTGGRFDPWLLREIADADEGWKVKGALVNAIARDELTKEIPVTAGQVAPWRRTRYAIKNNLPMGYRTRAMELVPDTLVKLDDGRAVLDQADRWASAMKLSPEERDALHSQLVRIDDMPEYMNDGADNYRAMGARRIAMRARREVLNQTFELGAQKYMHRYDDLVAEASQAREAGDLVRASAAEAQLGKQREFIRKILRLQNGLIDADTAYWYDAANRNRSFFNALPSEDAVNPVIAGGAEWVYRQGDELLADAKGRIPIVPGGPTPKPGNFGVRSVVDGAPEGDYSPLARAQRSLTAGAANAEPFHPDLGTPLFHGTSNRFAGDALESGKGRSADNLLGPGLYLTDNADVAASYMTKGREKNPVAYAAKWTGQQAPRFFDAEQAAPPAIRDRMRQAITGIGNADYLDVAQDDFDAVLRALDADAPVTEVYAKLRTALGGNRKNVVDEIIGNLNESFAEAGFDGLRYQGGVRTGNVKHNAYVIFDTPAWNNINTGESAPEGFSRIALSAFEPAAVPEPRKRWVFNAAGTEIVMSSPTEAWDMPQRVSPSLIAELTGDTMALPDPTEVRRVFNSPLVRGLMKLSTAEWTRDRLDQVMQLWRNTALLRPALGVRVVGDELARMYAEGADSPVNHPLRWMLWTLGDSKYRDSLPDSLQYGRSNVTGRMFDRHDEWAAGLNKADRAFWKDVHYKSLEGYAPFRYGQDGFNEAWHFGLGRLHLDPAAQLILRSENLDEAKTMWWDNLGDVRAKLAAAHPPSGSMPNARSGAALMEMNGAASYLDETAERIAHLTQGDERLVQALRDGHIVSADERVVALAREGGGEVREVDGVSKAVIPIYLDKGTPNPLFAQAIGAELDDVARQGFSNNAVVGRHLASTKGAWGGLDPETVGRYDRVVDKMFSALLGKPDDFLARSPYARQQYWDFARQRAAFVHPDDVEQFIRNAEAAGLPRDQLRTIRRLAGKAAGNETAVMRLDELDALAQSYAARQTKELLYDLSRRHQLADMAKLVAPFGEAWAEVLKVWTKQLTQPQRWGSMSQALRAAQSPDMGAVVNPGDTTYDFETGEMRQRGVFYRDENGNEMLTFPLSRQMMGLLGAPEVPMVGRAQNLSVGFSVMPGFGPVAQIPLGALSDRIDDPRYDTLRDLLFPNGTPQGSVPGQVAGAFVPAWADKVLTGAFEGYDQRRFSSVAIDAMRYRASTGEYGVSGSDASPEGVRALIDQSKTDARWMLVLRGLAQSVSPTAPSYEWTLTDKQGRRISALTLGRELQYLLNNDNPEVRDNAVNIFLDRHGDGMFALLQGKTMAVSPAGALPPTEQARRWLADNKFARDEYPLSYGLFAPRGENDTWDGNLYNAMIEGGERAQLTPEVALQLANRKVAQAVYYSVRNKIPGTTLTPEQSVALSNMRDTLEEWYPGYFANGDPVPGTPTRATPAQVIDELGRASTDTRFDDNPLTVELRDYFKMRTAMQQASQKAYGKPDAWLTRKDAAPMRAGLYEWGTYLAGQNASFRSAWETLLLPEYDRQLIEDGKGN